jgi:TP901-1 family phage major tail protein
MATGISGRYIYIKRSNGGSPETFTQMAALKDTTINQTESTVDTTTKDDAGKRSLLSGNIMLAMSVSGTGIFTNSSTLAAVRSDMRAGTHKNYQIYVASTESATAGGVYTGTFRITSLEEAGAFDGEMNYSLTMESDGAIAFATN